MGYAQHLPLILAAAWLLPLVSFALILALGPRMGRGGRGAGYVATAAIAAAFLFSAVALLVWVGERPVAEAAGHTAGAAGAAGHAAHAPPCEPIAGDWYALARFGSLEITVGYYIDGLTVLMFAMITLVALCIHVYSFGYMREELEPVTDPMVTLPDGRKLTRRGRFHRYYQYLSLFSFSMLGLVLAGNLAMVFVFWELVGICSYLLIGFYFERKSASDAGTKAFIVNRVGDFGMIVGLMALWGSLGTFAFNEIFAEVRPARHGYVLTVPEGMIRLAARGEIEEISRTAADPPAAIAARLGDWERRGYWLLSVAGLGIFCGCVGKSAQFPLHVWLPDAMEGPTPVSALIHAATMVAAGVYLAGRFYPVFTPEVLAVIAAVGAVTLLLAATIAITATDIKRVLAYSTVSQLGYMMLSLGVGGWIAGLFHLITHAFFKALLFLCSGSVIHATGTNEMPRMGGLRKKMPWTAGTMLVGCLAISGAGLPLAAIGLGGHDVGLSGFHSKEAILAAAHAHMAGNPRHTWLFYVALAGAAITALYMFRLWFMTFAGSPRDRRAYDHAHESPAVMCVPLVILAALAVVAAWPLPFADLSVAGVLQQAEPNGVAASGSQIVEQAGPEGTAGQSAEEPHAWLSLAASGAALVGFAVAAVFYGLRLAEPNAARRMLWPVYLLLRNKWYFDEIYAIVFVRPTLWAARAVAGADRSVIDYLADGLAHAVRAAARLDDWLDRLLVDGLVNRVAEGTYRLGVSLRSLQTGRLRQYVLTVAVGTVALFVLASLYWSFAVAGH